MPFQRKEAKAPSAGRKSKAGAAKASDEKGSRELAPSSAPSSDESAALDAMRGLDALAYTLRILGGHTIDIQEQASDDARERFEAWARHVLLGTPPLEHGEKKGGAGDRDWAGLESYVTEFRTEEVGAVQQTMSELRHVLWVFISCFTKALASDNQVDERTLKQLKSLKETTDDNDIARLRTEAVSAVRLVESAIEMRRGRYENQVQQLSEQLDRMTSDLVRAKRDGAVDALTGAFNRASLDEHLRAMTALGVLASSPPMVFMIDIDHFKWVNDSHGHAAGDEILKRVTAKIRSEFRRSSDLLSRFGGDEFTLVVQNAGTGTPTEIGDRILFAVRDCQYEHDGEAVRVSASVGGAVLKVGESSSSWMRRADEALYDAKNSGRDRCVIRTSEED